MAGVPCYVIDLARREARRWQEVIAAEKTIADRIVRETAAEVERVPEIARWVFARLYQAFGGLYRDEIRAWADAVGVSLGTATMLNCAYELSHLRLPKVFGCTAGVRWADGLGMVHLRTLDWPLPAMAEGTRLFRFRRGGREFVAVGVPGQVSVLSGMVPGAYSATINWAPPGAMPSFEFGPSFLLRHTLETCDTFAAALDALRRTPLSTSVFFTLCGTERDEACVIERGQRAAAVRPLVGPALAQANHHVAARFLRNNKVLEEVEGQGFREDSGCRADGLCRALSEAGSAFTLQQAAAVLNAPPVRNEYTVQRMIFCPRTGQVMVAGAGDLAAVEVTRSVVK
jgi:predicted choloylglycine hydrolase